MADDVQVVVGVSLDQLQEGIESASRTLSQFKEAIVTVIAAGGLADFIGKMTELAEQSERTAAMLGVSTVAAQELGALARLSGGSAEEFTTQLARLQVGLERGQKATSIQAAAFRAMGVDIHAMLAASPDKQVLILADAVKRLHDEGINAAPALMMISRGLAQMQPQLEQGSAGIKAWQDRMVEVGTVATPEMTTSLASLGREITMAKLAFTNFGQALVYEFRNPLGEIVKAIAGAVGELAKLIATGTLWAYTMAVAKDALMQLSYWMDKNSVSAEQLAASQLNLQTMLARTNTMYAALLKTAADAASKPIHVALPGLDKDGITKARDYYQGVEAMANAAVKTFSMSEEDKTQFLKAQLAIRTQMEIAAGQKADVAYAQMNKDIMKLDAQTTEHLVQGWKKVADSIASDFSNALDQVLSHQATFGQAMAQMFGKMIEQMIAKIIQLIAEYVILNAAAATFNALTGGSLAGPSLGALASSVFGLGKATGTSYVGSTGLELVHQGEAIIPAGNNPFNGGSGYGSSLAAGITNNMGGNVTMNVSAADAASFASMFRRNPNVFRDVLDKLSQRGSLATLLR